MIIDDLSDLYHTNMFDGFVADIQFVSYKYVWWVCSGGSIVVNVKFRKNDWEYFIQILSLVNSYEVHIFPVNLGKICDIIR